MSEIDWIFLLSVPALAGAVYWVMRMTREAVPAAIVTRPPGQLRVVAKVDAPNRNLSETLPRRSRALAEADRHFFGYERVRAPRYRPNVDENRAAKLRPVQVIRVSNRTEREEIAQQIPPHLKVIFLEEDPASSPAAPSPLSRD